MKYALMVLALSAGGEYSREVLPLEECLGNAVVIAIELAHARSAGGYMEVQRPDGSHVTIIGAWCREVPAQKAEAGK